MPLRIDASMILEQDWEKNIGFRGLDWRGQKVDDEIVSRGSSWLLSADETAYQQLTANDFKTGDT